MTLPLRAIGTAAALSFLVLTAGARADGTSRPASAPTAERSADEAMYDARYAMSPRGGAGQGTLEGSGATGGGGQHN